MGRLEERKIAYSESIDEQTQSLASGIIKELIAIRKSKGMTQKDIAEITGIMAPNIARIESCKRVPTINVLMKYANAVGKTLEIVIR